MGFLEIQNKPSFPEYRLMVLLSLSGNNKRKHWKGLFFRKQSKPTGSLGLLEIDLFDLFPLPRPLLHREGAGDGCLTGPAVDGEHRGVEFVVNSSNLGDTE